MSSRTRSLGSIQIFGEGKERRKTSCTLQSFLFSLCQKPVACIVWAGNVTRKMVAGFLFFFFFLTTKTQSWWWQKSRRSQFLKLNYGIWYSQMHVGYSLKSFKIRVTISFLTGDWFYHMWWKGHPYVSKVITWEGMGRLR